MRALFILLILISFNTQAQIVEATPTIPTNEYLDLLADHLELPNELTAKYANQDSELTIVLTITKEGSVFNPKIQNDSLQLESNLKKAIETLPKWNPKTEDGNPMVSRKAFKLIIPIHHTIAKEAITMPSSPKEGMQKAMEYIVTKLDDRSVYKGDIKLKVEFYVEEDGSLTNIRVLNSDVPSLNNEVIQLIESMPKWNPAVQDGVPVRSKFTMPIRIVKQ